VAPRPTFIMIGAGKCATRSVAEQLGAHPDVFFSDPKEPRFFSDPAKYPSRLDEYWKLYENAGDAIAIGEGSVSYSSSWRFPGTADRVFQQLPCIKLNNMARHPIDRG